MNKNLTVGDPARVYIGFTVPLFISVIFQQIYSIADSIIAGRFAGEEALSAVGAGYPVTMIFVAVAMGYQIGCNVVISKLFGSGDQLRTKSCIKTAVTAGFVISSAMTAAGIALSRFALRMIKTPEDVFSAGNTYLKIYTAGFVFVFIYNAATGVFNSLGDSRTPLYLLIGSSVCNILLDLLFVAVFRWGVAGVGWATFISQGAACIITLPVLLKRTRALAPGKKCPLFSIGNFRMILYVAVPSILQQSFVSVGNLFIQALVNGFGSSVVAGYSSAIKLNTFTITTFATAGNGISGFTAQNRGAGKPERIAKGLKTAIIFSLVMAVVFFIPYFFFGSRCIEIFMDPEKSTALAIETGIKFLKIVSPFYIIISVKLTCDGVLRGAEKMKSFMTATFTDLIMRVILAFVFSGIWNETGIWMAWPLSWAVATVMSFVFCMKTMKEMKKVRKINFQND